MTTSSLIKKELQSSNPSAIIELFQLDLIAGIHYTVPATIPVNYYFHAGTNGHSTSIKWVNTGNDVVDYSPIPVEAKGFAVTRGQLPRPTLSFANLAGTLTTILLGVNHFGATQVEFDSLSADTILINNDLTGARVTRKRTLEKFLPTSNYPTDAVPTFNQFDSSYPEFPEEIYFIDRKAAESREILQFELAANFDMAGVTAPRRLVTRDHFPSAGLFK